MSVNEMAVIVGVVTGYDGQPLSGGDRVWYRLLDGEIERDNGGEVQFTEWAEHATGGTKVRSPMVTVQWDDGDVGRYNASSLVHEGWRPDDPEERGPWTPEDGWPSELTAEAVEAIMDVRRRLQPTFVPEEPVIRERIEKVYRATLNKHMSWLVCANVPHEAKRERLVKMGAILVAWAEYEGRAAERYPSESGLEN